MHPILSASDEQSLHWRYSEVDEDQWNNGDGKQILDILPKIFRVKPLVWDHNMRSGLVLTLKNHKSLEPTEMKSDPLRFAC